MAHVDCLVHFLTVVWSLLKQVTLPGKWTSQVAYSVMFLAQRNTGTVGVIRKIFSF